MRSGVSARHGGHHVAKKFSTTTWPRVCANDHGFASSERSEKAGAAMPSCGAAAIAVTGLSARSANAASATLTPRTRARAITGMVLRAPTFELRSSSLLLACRGCFLILNVLDFLKVCANYHWRGTLSFPNRETGGLSCISRPHLTLPGLRQRVHLYRRRTRVLCAKGLRARAHPVPPVPAGQETRPRQRRRRRRAHDVRHHLLAVWRGDPSAFFAPAG